MNRWFTSDLHFGHHKIITYCDRPYENIWHMRDALVENWNSYIDPHDLVYVLGDFSFHAKREDTEQLLLELNGIKILIKGNHDHTPVRNANGWYAVIGEMKIRIGNELVLMKHIPISEKECHGLRLLHGHTHGDNHRGEFPSITPRRIDVGVDVWNYHPVPEDTIREIWDL